MGSPQQQQPSSYVEKIEHLLPSQFNSQTSYEDERCLVAVVLLANPTLIPTDLFRDVFLFRQNSLVGFCRRLLTHGKSESATFISYVRLIVLLLGRLLSLLETDNKVEASSKILMILSFECVSKLKKHDDIESLKLVTEILEVLTTYYSIARRKADNNGVNEILEQYLQPLWQFYMLGLRATIKEEGQPKEKSNTTNSADDQLMETTLRTVVQRNAGTIDVTENHSQEEAKAGLHTAMETFFRNELLATISQPRKKDTLPQSISQWLSKCLSSLSSRQSPTKDPQSTQDPTYSLKGLPEELQRSWHETVLLFVRCLASHPDMPSILEEIANPVVRLLLLHVVSPSEKKWSGALRVLAWTTCAAWVDRLHGFDWMLGCKEECDKNSQTAFGSASHFCALIRLASGEWRIQLGYRLAEPTLQRSSLSPAQQERAGIVNGCAQVLASLIPYLGQIADDLESQEGRNKRTLSPEALLHLRDSLEDTLQATSNYLHQLASHDTASSIDAEDTVMMQLLGTLLGEFDVFEATANVDTDEIMKAFHFAMIKGKGVNTKEQIVTGLMGVFECAKDDTYRALLLKEHDLVDTSMADFLCSYWSAMMESTASPRSVPCACHLTELWCFILTEYKSELRLSVDTSSIEASVIAWMHHTMRNYQPKGMNQEILQALSACVGCFVTLHGDTPPSEGYRRVLQAVLQLCSMGLG